MASKAATSTGANELVEKFLGFYRDYCRDEIGVLAQHFPKEQKSLYIEYDDLFTFDPNLAEDWLDQPGTIQSYAEAALPQFDLPADIDLSGAYVRLTDTEEALQRLAVSQLGSEHIGNLVAVQGQLAKVTRTDPRLEVAAYECLRCGTATEIEQSRMSVQEPHECRSCERKGPFNLDDEQSEWVDQRKLKLEELPGERTTSRGQSRLVYADDDLCHFGGENGLADLAGDQVTVIATVHADTSDLQKRNATPEAGMWLEGHSVVLDPDDRMDVDIDAHRETFEAYAERDDAVDLLTESIAPELLAAGDDDLEIAMEAAVAWLFNAYRIDPEGMGQIRGDIHYGLIGDPGRGKSTLLSNLAELTTNVEYRSGSGLSKAGLTAAAVQEEFAGKSEWTLEPGVLPRANGGHCIIDEVDDVVDEKTKAIHDALEGDQMVKVDKAGISADLPTRTALLASGNPVDGRFDRYKSIAEQLDLDPALISRMDILLAVQDIPDPDQDRDVATHVLDAYDEMSRAERHERGQAPEPDDPKTVERPIDKPVFRAWLAYAREEVFPTLTEAAKDELAEFYVEVRNLNDGHDDEDGDDPIPATPRTLEAGIRVATAFARVHLSDTVEVEHAERAIEILRQVVGLHFDPETGKFDANRVDTGKPKSQKQRKEAIRDTLRELDDGGSGGVAMGKLVNELEEQGFNRQTIRDEVEKLHQDGHVINPGGPGTVRWIE